MPSPQIAKREQVLVAVLAKIVRQKTPLFLILLLAFGLRLYQLTAVPPGLTHDEANHGREAVEILDGVYRYFFPLNYGSEPIYSYTVAGSMAVLGENLFALRYVNVVFGVLAICLTYVWGCWAFGRRVGLLTAVLLTLSFWPLASSRQALRAGMLPFFTVTAVLFFWWLLFRAKRQQQGWLAIALALSLVATFHIYLAARVAWLIFPLFLGYLAIYQPALFKQKWRAVVAALGLAGLLVVPMFLYLQQQPEAQTRLGMLDGTLEAVRSGNLWPIFKAAGEAFFAFFGRGFGDQFLAYNIPGRPIFEPLTAVFFLLGLGVAVWHWKRPSYAFVLLWFFIGILPSLITGSTANTTRNLAALPAIFLLPAVGYTQLAQMIRNKLPSARVILPVVLAGWLFVAGSTTVRDYFVVWATSPEVRGAYQHNLVEMIKYIETADLADHPLIFSSVYPGPAHDTSIATILSENTVRNRRWIDARQALILPAAPSPSFFIPASTPPHPAFGPLLDPVATVSLRADDLDPSFVHYRQTAVQPDWLQLVQPIANVANSVLLRQAQWLAPTTPPGGVAEMLTVWQVIDPVAIGPAVPPAYTTDVVLFTHVVAENGGILVQQDRLDAPSWSWQTGDLVIQIHSMWIAPETAVGSYSAVTGFYDRLSGERRPILNKAGEIVGTHIDLPALEIMTQP